MLIFECLNTLISLIRNLLFLTDGEGADLRGGFLRYFLAPSSRDHDRRQQRATTDEHGAPSGVVDVFSLAGLYKLCHTSYELLRYGW